MSRFGYGARFLTARPGNGRWTQASGLSVWPAGIIPVFNS
jgi:hypothetical protein